MLENVIIDSFLNSVERILYNLVGFCDNSVWFFLVFDKVLLLLKGFILIFLVEQAFLEWLERVKITGLGG